MDASAPLTIPIDALIVRDRYLSHTVQDLKGSQFGEQPNLKPSQAYPETIEEVRLIFLVSPAFICTSIDPSSSSRTQLLTEEDGVDGGSDARESSNQVAL